MKVLSIQILYKGNAIAAQHDLDSFSYFQRGSIQEFMIFFAKTLAERTTPNQRQKIQQDNYVGHVFVRSDGLTAVLVSDAEYPTRTAFSVLGKLIDEFSNVFPQASKWPQMTPSTTAPLFPQLKTHLQTIQNPASADPIMKVQQELDETKIILHKTMESLMQRGEKLDDLVARSDALSAQSKMFYKTAKSTNQCCVMSHQKT